MQLKKITQNENGAVLALYAILLPIFLLIGALIIESGNLYIRHSELKHLSKTAGESALIEFSKIIIQQANTNHTTTCTPPTTIPPTPIPTICSSTNPFDFISPTEIETLANHPTTKTQIQQNAQQFAKTYDPQKKLQNSNIEIIFPNQITSTNIEIKITLKTNPQLTFQNIMNNTLNLKVESTSQLPIN